MAMAQTSAGGWAGIGARLAQTGCGAKGKLAGYFAFAERASARCTRRKPTATMFKAVFKTIALLIILFVMLYVGMNNTHEIDFLFPIAGTTAKTPIHASAALIYFGIFAVGALAGAILIAGGGGKRSGAPKEK